jgi:hypothetical protein
MPNGYFLFAAVPKMRTGLTQPAMINVKNHSGAGFSKLTALA